MAISTINQNGLNAPLTLTSPVLNSPAFSGTPTGTLVSANMPTGSVLQVIHGGISTNTTNATTTLADTGVTATITPKFSTSKILVLATINGIYNGANNTVGVALAILRNSTNLNAFCNYTSYIGAGAGAQVIAGAASNYLDSPATTSATTYKVQFARAGGSAGNTVYVQANSDYSSITLMEIAG